MNENKNDYKKIWALTSIHKKEEGKNLNVVIKVIFLILWEHLFNLGILTWCIYTACMY